MANPRWWFFRNLPIRFRVNSPSQSYPTRPNSSIPLFRLNNQALLDHNSKQHAGYCPKQERVGVTYRCEWDHVHNSVQSIGEPLRNTVMHGVLQKRIIHVLHHHSLHHRSIQLSNQQLAQPGRLPLICIWSTIHNNWFINMIVLMDRSDIELPQDYQPNRLSSSYS